VDDATVAVPVADEDVARRRDGHIRRTVEMPSSSPDLPSVASINSRLPSGVRFERIRVARRWEIHGLA